MPSSSLPSKTATIFPGSTLTRSAIPAGGLGVATYIVLGIVGIVPGIGHYLPTSLGTPARGLALGQSEIDILGPAIVSVVLIGGAVILARLAFRRQEV